jgi:hypothetical protein
LIRSVPSPFMHTGPDRGETPATETALALLSTNEVISELGVCGLTFRNSPTIGAEGFSGWTVHFAGTGLWIVGTY